jgi:hypothetical protein
MFIGEREKNGDLNFDQGAKKLLSCELFPCPPKIYNTIQGILLISSHQMILISPISQPKPPAHPTMALANSSHSDVLMSPGPSGTRYSGPSVPFSCPCS